MERDSENLPYNLHGPMHRQAERVSLSLFSYPRVLASLSGLYLQR